jgi:hypothetical protein
MTAKTMERHVQFNTKTIYPSGGVPADFNSWINHIQKQLLITEQYNNNIEFQLINARGNQRQILSLPVRWVDSISEQIHAGRNV